MTDLSEAERYLLQQIRKGDGDAWSQLVERYEGRLLAFARTRIPSRADAEDLVQETFLQFLKGLAAFREEASLETYLFMILRRRIVDTLRGKRVNVCIASDSGADEDDSGSGSGVTLPAADLTASAYARRDEQIDVERSALAESLAELIGGLKEQQNFRDLKIVEMLFYGQMRNKEIARRVTLEENHVALIKHRWLKQIREAIARRMANADLSGFEGSASADSLLTEVWEQNRLSCPKRSTVGRFMLRTLEPPWQDYVEFHIHGLGCRFCKANLEDLQSQTRAAPHDLRHRIMQSTVGFFRKPS